MKNISYRVDEVAVLTLYNICTFMLKKTGVILLSVVVAVALLCILLKVPEWMANQYRFDCVKDWAAQVAANRATLVNLLGGAAVGLTIYLTYRNLRIAQDSFKVTQNT